MIGRKKEILDILLNSPHPIVSEELAQKYHVSPRTIRYDIQALNKQFIAEGVCILSDTHKGYWISDENKLKILDYLNQNFFVSKEYFPTEPIHRQACIAMFLLSTDRPLSISYLAEQLFISKSSCKQDIDQAILILKDMNVSVEKNRYGTIVACAEERRRLRMVFILMYYISEPRMIQTILSMISGIDFHKIYDRLLQIVFDGLYQFHMRCKDVAIEMYLITCMITYMRSSTKCGIEGDDCIKEPIILFIKERAESFFKLPLQEWHFLEFEFIYRTLESIEKRDVEESQRILHDFCNIVTQEYSITFSEDERQLLLDECERILSKSRKKIMVRNEYTSQIIRNYPFAFEIALNLRSLIHAQNLYVPLDDIATIALQIEQVLPKIKGHIKIAIVSTLGDVVLRRLRNMIASEIRYENIEIETFYQYEMNRVLDEKNKYDCVFSTDEKLKAKSENMGISYIMISPFLNHEDMNLIHHTVLHLLASKRDKRKRDALKYVHKYMEFLYADHIDCANIGNFNTIRYVFMVKEHILMVRINGGSNYVRIVNLKETYLYQNESVHMVFEYSCNTDEMELMQAMYFMIEEFTSDTMLKDIRRCKNKQMFEELLLSLSS